MQPKEFFGWLCKSQQDATFCLFLIRNLFFLRDKNLSHSQSLIKNTYFPRRKAKATEQETDGCTQSEDSADMQQEEKQEEPPHTRDLCIELLKQLNCEVSVEEEDENRLYFEYHGEHFIIDATNESFFINIWDPKWYIVPLDDLEQMSNVRKAINTINNYSGTTIVYCIEEEEQKFVLHSKRQCILPKDLPNVKEHLSALLNDFFTVKLWLSEQIGMQNKENR